MDYCIISIYSYKTIKKYTIINFDHKVSDGVSAHHEESSRGTYVYCCERRDVISPIDAETGGFTIITYLQCAKKKKKINAMDNLKNYNLPTKYDRYRQSMIAKMNLICMVG